MICRVENCKNLITRIQNGEVEAFNLLYCDYGEIFLSVARMYLYDKSYAEDLLNDVFIDLLKSKARSFDNTKNGFNWIITVIKNKAFKYNRNNSYKYLLMEEMEDTVTYAVQYNRVVDDIDYILNKVYMTGILKEFSIYQSMLVYYKFWQELTIKEIAKIYNKPISTIHRDITVVISKLKYLIDENLVSF